MRYVYLLSTYHEYGSESVKATLNRSRLPTLLEKLLAERFKNWDPAPVQSSLSKLLSETSDESLSAEGSSPHNLTDGWGGIQLHVVELVAWA